VNKPETHNGNLANLPPALLPLTEDARWVAWTWEYRANKDGSGKWTKVPRVADRPNRFAESNDPETWGKYQD
jgi:primase-polymerase (primpol)-like protein